MGLSLEPHRLQKKKKKVSYSKPLERLVLRSHMIWFTHCLLLQELPAVGQE